MSTLDLFIGVPRVSSDEQAKSGHSLRTQERALRDYAAKLKARRVVIIPDDISGTTPIRERPGGAELYEHIDARPDSAAVCFFDVSRVARDVDVFEVVQLMRDLRRSGIEFHMLNRGRIDLDDPFAKVLVFMEGAAAANENVTRTRKATLNRRAKAEEGKIVANGRPPYCHDQIGFRKHAEYVVNEQRADYIRAVAGKIIAGETTDACAHWLQDQGAPYSRGSNPAKGWYQSTLLRILRNRALIGQFRYGKIIVKRDDLRVLDDDTFDALQAALTNHNHITAGETKREYLLRSRLFCTCGRRMCGMPGQRGIVYYRCTTMTAKRVIEPCGQGYIRADGEHGIDALVWAKVLEFCSDEERIRRGVQQHNATRTAKLNPLHNDLKHVESDLCKERTKLDRLSVALGDASDAAVQVMGGQIRASAERVAALEAKQVSLKKKLAQPIELLDEAAIIATIRKTRAKLSKATFAQKVATLAIFGVECHVKMKGRQGETLRPVDVTFDILESVSLAVEV